MQVIHVYGYIRVSTKSQSKEGYSLSEQKDEIVNYCKDNGFNLVNIFEDGARSGAVLDEDNEDVMSIQDIQRDGLQDMLSQLKDNDIKYIVVLTTNRLWRSDIVKGLIQRKLKKYSVDIKAIDRPYYSIYNKNPNDKLVNGVLELLDEYERSEITIKMKRGRDKKASLGGYAGGGAPLGYKSIRGTKELHVDTSKCLAVQRAIFLKDCIPNITLQGIADILNSEGHTTAQGKSFKVTQVKRILDHRQFYEGVYKYGDKEAQGKHKPLV